MTILGDFCLCSRSAQQHLHSHSAHSQNLMSFRLSKIHKNFVFISFFSSFYSLFVDYNKNFKKKIQPQNFERFLMILVILT